MQMELPLEAKALLAEGSSYTLTARPPLHALRRGASSCSRAWSRKQGLDTDSPRLVLSDGSSYVGRWDQSVGTLMAFAEEGPAAQLPPQLLGAAGHSAPPQPTPKTKAKPAMKVVSLRGTTSKRLIMSRGPAGMQAR